MGADGGTIPKRCELVKNKKKKEKVDKNVQNAAKLKTCQKSNEPLKKPVVACRYGKLYNKEAILEGLLGKTLGQNEVTKHIKNRNDFKELKLADNKAYGGDGPDRGMVYKDFNDTPWQCPVTALPMNGTNVFKVNWICGCVVSEKAMNETKADACLFCNGPLDKTKLVQLYPHEELLEQYKEKHAEEIAAKKAKKAEKVKSVAEEPIQTTSPETPTNGLIPFKMPSMAQFHQKPTGSKITATAGTSDLHARKHKLLDKGSIQDNPNISQAVKNMFTTSEQAKKQKKAHWVTHNPLYF